jgi:hypothetical protein
MEPEPKSALQAARTVVQPITAPLSRAAIFLTSALNPEPATRGVLRSFCADFSGLFRAVNFATLRQGFRASWVLDLLRGISFLEHHDRRSCIPSARFAPERAMRLPRRANCCSTSERSTWICVSSLRRKSWRVLGTWFPRWMKCTAFETSMTAISSDLLTARRIPAMK